MNGHFDPETLRLLNEAQEVDIETRQEEGSPTHRTVVWVVVMNGEVFVRSVRGLNGRWYREISANPTGALHAGDQRIPVPGGPGHGRANHGSDQRRLPEQVRAGVAGPDGGDGEGGGPAHDPEALAGLRTTGCRAS